MTQELNIEVLAPREAWLKTIRSQAALLTITDFSDREQLKAVHDKRIELRDARIETVEECKAMRDGANKFAKEVIAKEKELVAITEIEEDRLLALEDKAKEIAILEERNRKLPDRKKRLADASVGLDWTDDQINTMDDVAFDSGLLQLIEERDRQAQIAEQARIAEENAQKQAELDARQAEIEAKEKAIRDAELAKQREAELEAARIEGERIAAERIEAQRIEAERKAKEEAEQAAFWAEKKRLEDEARAAKEREALEQSKKYQDFLSKNKYTDDGSFKVEETAGEFVLWSKVDTLKK
jgi:hypothetical protein